MYSLAVINFPKSIDQIKLVGGFEKIVPGCLKKYFIQKAPVVHETVILDNMGLKIKEIQFPYLMMDKDEILRLKVQQAFKKVKKIIYKDNISGLIVDKRMEEFELLNDFLNHEQGVRLFDGTDFYGVYLTEILRYLCRIMGIKLKDLPVTLIMDGMNDFYRLIIKDLCTKIRFMSIISLDIENFIPLADEILNESGLVVSLGKSLKGRREGCGIVVNFSKNKDFLNADKFSKNYLILNLGEKILDKNFFGVIITKIKMKSNNNELCGYSWMNEPGFCEVLAYTSMKIGVRDSVMLFENKNKVVNCLKSKGYEICGIKGYRGDIGPDTLKDFAKTLKPKIV